MDHKEVYHEQVILEINIVVGIRNSRRAQDCFGLEQCQNQKGMGITMLKLYLCPKCNSLRVTSRRKQVVCYSCDDSPMYLTDLDFVVYSEMAAGERALYIRRWKEQNLYMFI